MKIYRVHKGPSSTEEIRVGSKTLLAIGSFLTMELLNCDVSQPRTTIRRQHATSLLVLVGRQSAADV